MCGAMGANKKTPAAGRGSVLYPSLSEKDQQVQRHAKPTTPAGVQAHIQAQTCVIAAAGLWVRSELFI